MDDKKIEIKKIDSVTMSTTLSNSLPEQIAENFTEISKHRAATRTDISVTENKLNNKYSTISSTKDTTFNTLTTQSPITTTHKQEMTRDKYYNYTLKKDDGIFQYLPIDILKNVHSTLKSQPVSFEGKLHFLKMFEKTLMSEIGKKISYSWHIPSSSMIFLKGFTFLFIDRISPHRYYVVKSKSKRCGLSRAWLRRSR